MNIKPPQKKYCASCGKKLLYFKFPNGYDVYTGKKLFYLFGVCPDIKDYKDAPRGDGTYMGHTLAVFNKDNANNK